MTADSKGLPEENKKPPAGGLLIKSLPTDKYDENIWEFVSAATKFSLQVVVETNLRSEEGETIERPLGSPKKSPGQDGIVHARVPGINHPSQVSKLVAELKEVTGGIPVGVKIAAGKNLEKDLNWVIECGAELTKMINLLWTS